jgi:hypothetical protein
MLGAAMRISALLFLSAALVVTTGCDKPAPGGPTDAAPAATPKPEPVPARPRPEDLDVSGIREPLKCAPNAKKPVCTVLSEFEKADAWNLDTIRGTDARYFGQVTVIEKGQTRTPFVFLIVKKVPTNDVAPGDLAIKVALREVDASLEKENTHAPKLLRALERDDVGSRYNAAADYLKTYAPSNWDGAVVTAGPSTLLYSEGGVYVRETKTRRLQVVKLSAVTHDVTPGDGMYGMLHPVSW